MGNSQQKIEPPPPNPQKKNPKKPTNQEQSDPQDQQDQDQYDQDEEQEQEDENQNEENSSVIQNNQSKPQINSLNKSLESRQSMLKAQKGQKGQKGQRDSVQVKDLNGLGVGKKMGDYVQEPMPIQKQSNSAVKKANIKHNRDSSIADMIPKTKNSSSKNPSNPTNPSPLNPSLQPAPPLSNLPQSGQLRLRITILRLALTTPISPSSQLTKENSLYTSTMQWKKNKDGFSFLLKEDQGYVLNIDARMEGSCVEEGKDLFWLVLCPVWIGIGKEVKLGRGIICDNLYNKLRQQGEGEDEKNQEQQVGPSAKHIDFKLPQQTFEKWNQKSPKYFYTPQPLQALHKVFPQFPQTRIPFHPYKQITRYFDQRRIWRASTYFQETSKQFKAWVIEVLDPVFSIGGELYRELGRREDGYARGVKRRLHGK